MVGGIYICCRYTRNIFPGENFVLYMLSFCGDTTESIEPCIVCILVYFDMKVLIIAALNSRWLHFF